MIPDHILSHAEIRGHSSDRALWLSARRMGIGASEVAAVLGVSPYSSPLNVYAAKRGALDESEGTERMRWGTRLERVVLEGLAEERNRREWPELDGRLLQSRHWPWMLATPDGWLYPRPEGDPMLVEIKTSDRGDRWDELPPHVFLQVQAQLVVTGEPSALVAVLLRGNELRQFPVDRDPELIADLVEACRLFWDRVERGEPPPTDGTEATSRALRRLYPDDQGQTIALADALLPLARERADVVASIARAEERRDEIDNAIKAAMGTAAKALLPDGSGFRWATEQHKARACPACAHVLADAKTVRKFTPIKAPKKKEG